MQKTPYEFEKHQAMTRRKNVQTLIDTDKAWEQLSSRLHREGLIPEVQVLRRDRFFPVWTRWAATLLVLVSTGIFLYSTLNRGMNARLLTITNGEEHNTMVQVLDDGTVVYLADNTTLTYPATFDKATRTVMLDGEAFFDIQHRPDQPFIVETSEVTIRVLGTSFNVRAKEASHFELFVEQGLVRASLNEDAATSMDVYKGEVLSISDNKLSKSLIGDLTSSWKMNQMHFKDETLLNVISVINRNYNSNLFIEQPGLMDRRLTVTFYNNSLPTIIELICLSMNLEAEELPGSGILLKPKT